VVALAVESARDVPDRAAMQATAHRIGLPTTAFLVPERPGETYRIRWFTPHEEINLCGHATIAAARYVFDTVPGAAGRRLRFVSPNGVLHARGLGGTEIALDLPAVRTRPCAPPPGLVAALGTDVLGCHLTHDDVLVELASPAAVAAVAPDFPALARLPFRGHIVTAAAVDAGADFVSRTFFPSLGVDEDQVCVTAHAKLGPFWSARLGRATLTGLQLSQRGGRVRVTSGSERVEVIGTAVPRAGGAV
jgi:predicted PhzF superfamily epimerase YddE/YHI9